MNGLEAIAFVAEQKIEEAIAEGAFDKLPGSGKPLVFDDLSHLPPDMRMAYTILKNSGFLENETAAKSNCMKDLLAHVPDEGRAYGKMQRLSVMMKRVRRHESLHLPEAPRKEPLSPEDSPYLEKLIERV